MRTRLKSVLLCFLMTVFFVIETKAQEIPLVYDVEHTGSIFPLPVLPDFADLPVVRPLTDPFEWSDGSGRDTTFASWSRRRSEIKAEIENYEIGIKPSRPDSIYAVALGDSALFITIIENGDTLNLYSTIKLPEGDGPFPAIIGMGGGTGSLPSEIFSSRKVAQITFDFGQVMAHTQTRSKEPINKLYPDLISMGAYSAWSWGVSRLIDGLELVQNTLPIDLAHLAVSGCSFAGKMALFAGAFDERIALTIAQESGGGGAAAWRVSETQGSVETLGATNHAWFMESMFRFSGKNTAKLPHDHHELMAMIAPRALLVLGNPDFEWLADGSGYVSCRAAHEVWKNFGISDRFGFSIVGGHGHCALPKNQYPEVEAFVEKFLLGDNTANTTDVTIHPYPEVNYTRWYEWWQTGNPVFPEQLVGVTKTFEAECGIVGDNWYKLEDSNASNGAYAVSKPDKTNDTKETIDDSGLIEIPFKIDTAGNYSLFCRVNCKSTKNDSYWVKIDGGIFKLKTSFATNGWEWKSFGEFILEKGEHTLSISYRENGGQIDKICLTSFLFYEPKDLEEQAENICTPEISTVGLNINKGKNNYSLGRNFPNPFSNKTAIEFEIPEEAFVSLKIYNVLGLEVAELTGKQYSLGKHTVEYDTKDLPKGIYLYTIKTEGFSASRKMIKQN